MYYFTEKDRSKRLSVSLNVTDTRAFKLVNKVSKLSILNTPFKNRMQILCQS